MKTLLYIAFPLLLLSSCFGSKKKSNREIPNPAERTLPNPEVLAKDKFPETEESDNSVMKTLKGTKWNSEFYHYHNFYHFQTDSSGYFDDGQVAWSCPIDLKAQKIPEDKILYSGKQPFRYQIERNKLTIVYKVPNDKKSKNRIFTYRQNEKDWISVYKYTYGNEVIQPGEREEFFTAVPKIEK